MGETMASNSLAKMLLITKQDGNNCGTRHRRPTASPVRGTMG